MQKAVLPRSHCELYSWFLHLSMFLVRASVLKLFHDSITGTNATAGCLLSGQKLVLGAALLEHEHGLHGHIKAIGQIQFF